MSQLLNKEEVTLSEEERLAWLRLIRTENIGPITFYQLIDHYGSASEALKALPELAKRGGRKKPFIAADLKAIENEYKALTKMGAHIITPLDREYPLALTPVEDAPPVLYALGNLELLNKDTIGVVGARAASLNGQKLTRKIAHDLGAKGFVIASGLARGIDRAAHEGSLQTGTIAVIATGLDQCYPPENHDICEVIKENGLIITENPLGAKPHASAFPRRNRIVSGLARGVVVIEANMRSGSLITARMAGEQGREVMAVPGSPLDPRCAGPNHLIREGATLVRDARDIIEAISSFNPNQLREPAQNTFFFTADKNDHNQLKNNDNNPKITPEEILTHLSYSPILVDELLRACHVTISELQGFLLELELAGRVKRLPNGKISLANN